MLIFHKIWVILCIRVWLLEGLGFSEAQQYLLTIFYQNISEPIFKAELNLVKSLHIFM